MPIVSDQGQPSSACRSSPADKNEIAHVTIGPVQRPAVRDVARYAGATSATVSNVFNHSERVTASRQQPVIDAISQLGFVRHEVAQQLRSGYANTLGLLLLDAWKPAFHDMARGVGETTNAADSNLLIANSGRELERERTYLRSFAESRVPGMTVVPHGDLAAAPQELETCGVSVVAVDPTNEWNHSTSVAVDDVAGGSPEADRLVKLGHRRFLFVADAAAAAPAHKRLAGRRQAVAIGVVHALGRHGIVVPDVVSVIRYDDIALAQMLPVPLNTVRHPRFPMGSSAVMLLLDCIGGHTHAQEEVVVQPKLFLRSSTKALEIG